MENEELSQLFVEAMEATDRRVDESRRLRGDDTQGDEGFDLDLEVDHAATNMPVAFFRDALADTDEDEDDSQDLTEPGAEANLASADQPEASNGNAVVDDGFDETLGDIDIVVEALDDIEAEPDTSAEIERLLTSSFGRPPSDDDPDLAFPEFDDDDNITSLDEGGLNPGAVADAQRESDSLRRQLNSVSRTLTDRESELQSAQSRIATLEAQVVQTARQSANAGREFDSFRRRSEREQEDTRKFAIEKLLKEFLSVLDNLERAMEHAGEHRDTALGKGVEMTLEQFVDVLARAGAGKVEAAEGDPFDPIVHEAVGQEKHATVPRDHVIRTLQKGLLLKERLVRAAMVVVSLGDGKEKLPESETAAPGDAGEGTTKRKKKRRKKKKLKKNSEGTETEAEGLEAAAAEGSTSPPKKRRKKRKRKVKTGEGKPPEAEKTGSESDDDS